MQTWLYKKFYCLSYITQFRVKAKDPADTEEQKVMNHFQTTVIKREGRM